MRPAIIPKSIFAALVIFLAFFTLGAQHSNASESFASGSAKVNIVELYTSEGCSSCPPADRWLSKLKDDDQLFSSVIPLAFHVDYWNYLGWRDEFSDAEHSKRQRRYHDVGRTASVYTPGFIVNGEEWRGFFSLIERGRPPITAEQAQVGELTLQGKEDTFQIEFSPITTPSQALIINLVYLGTDLSTEIKRGENAGKRLKHDFVVLAHTTQRLNARGDNFTAALRRGDVKNATAVAAWVSRPDDPAPIQAVGGWLAVH